MKQIFRCDFCDKIDVAEEIMKHEVNCLFNYKRKSCSTCKHAENKIKRYDCNVGKEIPEGQMIIDCDKYEWDKVDHTHSNPIAFNNLFGGIFG